MKLLQTLRIITGGLVVGGHVVRSVGREVFALVMGGISLAGCNRLNSFDRLVAGEPKIDDSVWFRVDASGTEQKTQSHDDGDASRTERKTQSSDASLPNYIPSVCLPPPPPVITDGNTIIECTSQMKVVIDRRFDKWMDSLATWTNGSNTASDIIVVGAGLAGSLAGGATSQIMNAVSSGITGTKKAVSEDVLLTKSVELIITQMKTNRAQWATIIANRLDATKTATDNGNKPPISDTTTTTTKSTSSETVRSKNLTSSTTTVSSSKTVGSSAQAGGATTASAAKSYRTLSEAWDDLQTYSRQGAFNEALATIQTNVGAQSAACQAAKVNQKQGTTPQSTDANAATDPATGSSPGAATATSPCPPTATSTTPSPAAPAPAAAGKPAAGAAKK